jgi:hypothetical protein
MIGTNGWRKLNVLEAIEFSKSRVIEHHKPQDDDFYETIKFTDGARLVARPGKATGEVEFYAKEGE